MNLLIKENQMEDSVCNLLIGPQNVSKVIAFHVCLEIATQGHVLILGDHGDINEDVFLPYSCATSFPKQDYRSGNPDALSRVGIKYVSNLKEVSGALALLHTLSVIPDAIILPNIDRYFPADFDDFSVQATVLQCVGMIMDTISYISSHHKPISVVMSSMHTYFDFACGSVCNTATTRVTYSRFNVNMESESHVTIAPDSTNSDSLQHTQHITIHTNSGGVWEYH